jgi:hypothetical protein
VTRLAIILDQIDSGSVLLPEFQRGCVWNREQVRGLMRSLYLGYPVGSLLTWETVAGDPLSRGEAVAAPAFRVLILDGQQRITTMYGITRGRPPAFFHGMSGRSPGCGCMWRTRPSRSTRRPRCAMTPVGRCHVAVHTGS